MSATAYALICGPPWCAPQGPGHPWGSPTLALYDSIRVLIILAALWTVGSSIRSAVWTDDRDQCLRFLALAAFAVVAGGTELEHIGDDIHWRFVATIVAVTCSAVGTREVFRPVRDR